ncbi:putative nucleotide-diphospho-sugar transferase [Helianthus annuus]|nr:putative nucleotide-diphospho-sugar transferase [Helianthus annuus]KAJ0932871.1 putative nucleotide-diphospho-sugar transferase [Helianthus annuus]
MRVCFGWRQFLLFVTLVFFLTRLISVLELHHDPAGSHQTKTKKYNHLVFGPAAGEGLPNRLQCKGHKALNKSHISSSSNTSNGGDGVTFVTVFTVYNSSVGSGSSESTMVGKVSYNKVDRSMAILNTFINFIQLMMPQSNTVILTDPASSLPLKRNRVTVYPIQGEYSRDKLMLQRIRSYIAFLEDKLKEQSRKPGKRISNIIFTDSDIAVVGDVGEIFTKYEDFHVALTFRNNKQQPLNSGFIAVRGTRDGILRAKIFLEEVLKVYSSKYMEASRMLGDQLAIASVVKSRTSLNAKAFSAHQPFLEDINGASVLFLPCEVYNWTPPEGAGQFHGMPLDVKVVHFKGSRKRLMLESWNFLQSSTSHDLSDMLCLVLSSGRTKYDF